MRDGHAEQDLDLDRWLLKVDTERSRHHCWRFVIFRIIKLHEAKKRWNHDSGVASHWILWIYPRAARKTYYNNIRMTHPNRMWIYNYVRSRLGRRRFYAGNYTVAVLLEDTIHSVTPYIECWQTNISDGMRCTVTALLQLLAFLHFMKYYSVSCLVPGEPYKYSRPVFEAVGGVSGISRLKSKGGVWAATLLNHDKEFCDEDRSEITIYYLKL